MCLRLAIAVGLPYADFARVGEAAREFEVVFEDVVNASDDVGDDRLRRVVNAARLAQTWVVFGEESLVEVNHWVFASRPLAEVLKNPRHVRVREQRDEIVNRP